MTTPKEQGTLFWDSCGAAAALQAPESLRDLSGLQVPTETPIELYAKSNI